MDRYRFTDPVSPEEVLGELGLRELVELVRIEHSSYCWWLKDQIEVRAVLEHVVRPHPGFAEVRVEGRHWGWARKGGEQTARATPVARGMPGAWQRLRARARARIGRWPAISSPAGERRETSRSGTKSAFRGRGTPG